MIGVRGPREAAGPSGRGASSRGRSAASGCGSARSPPQRSLRARRSRTASRPRPLVLVVEGDPAAILGVALAGFGRRDLNVIGSGMLDDLSSWLPDRRFTLVISPDRLPFEFLGRLCAAADDGPGRRQGQAVPFAVMTAASLEALSRLVARSVARLPVHPRRSHKAVFSIPREAGDPGPAVSGIDVLLDPSKEQVEEAFLTPGGRLGSVSFNNHGRDYCGPIGGAGICCQGEAGQQQGRCLDGMTCFNPAWLRVAPRRIDADLIFANSCSVFRPAQSLFDLRPTIGLELLEGSAHGLIASFEVAGTSPSESLLFHALADAGYTLAEMALLLNRAGARKKQLVAVGDAEFRLASPGPGARTRSLTIEPIDAQSWRVAVPAACAGVRRGPTRLRLLGADL